MSEKYKKNYIVLTGGTGFIGLSVAYYLLNMGKNVIIIDSNYNSNTDNLPNKHNLLTFNINCCNSDCLENIFISYSIDVVIHFSSYKVATESIQTPMKYYWNNLVSFMNCIKLSQEYGVKKFIFSSCANIDKNQSSPSFEDNPYSMSQQMIECIIRDFAKTNQTMNFMILRCFNPVGTIGNGLIRDNYEDNPDSLMLDLIQTIQNKNTLKILGNETFTHNYIHIEDLAKGHIAAIDFENSGYNFELFKLGTSKSYTILEIIKTFGRINNIKIDYEYVQKRPAVEQANIYFNPDKTQNQLGWIATKTLEDMCDFRFMF